MRIDKILTSALLSATAMAAAEYDTPPALDTALRGASVGEVIDWPNPSVFQVPALNAAPNRLEPGGGTLLYSDDPEKSPGAGILYQETVYEGMGRVYLYHTNDTQTPSRFSIVLENTGDEAITITPGRRALSLVSADYIRVGRTAVQEFYEMEPPFAESFSIPAGERALLDSELDSMTAGNTELLGTIHDFTTTGPVRVSTVMVNGGGDTLAEFPAMEFLEDDGFLREGTFPETTRTAPGDSYAYDMSSGVARLRIGDNNAQGADPPSEGLDAQSGDPGELRGNYGITYEIDVEVVNPGGRKLAVLLNPRGGDYGGYIRTTYDGQETSTLVPSDSPVIPPTTEAGVCALLEPNHANGTLTLELIPAGASSLAIDLLLVPYGEETPPPKESWSVN